MSLMQCPITGCPHHCRLSFNMRDHIMTHRPLVLVEELLKRANLESVNQMLNEEMLK